MYSKLQETIREIEKIEIDSSRRALLDAMSVYLSDKIVQDTAINLSFICTHNSRRSHLAQVWAKVAATYYGMAAVYCYSGGTEETAIYHKVIETLSQEGLQVQKLSEGVNPIYSLKYDANKPSIIGFSKRYDDPFNPKTNFTAVMTCSEADAGCPHILGADKRFALSYIDPKIADGTDVVDQVYQQRSREIASEMFYLFSKVKKS